MENTQENIYRNRWKILFNVVMMTFMACLDSSIINVALPVMSNKLQVTMGSIQWVVTIYLIVISSTILIFGTLGDIIGKTNVFKFGILTFTIGSLLCGISNSLQFLVISRMLQGLGAAAAMATNQGIITQVFPGNERGRALGITGTFVALGTMVGPPLGGFIVSTLSWNFIFLINIPIGLFTFIMGTRILPKRSINTNKKFNLKETFLQFSIFKNTLFSLSIFCGFISFIAISSPNIIQPFYLQKVLNLSPSKTGLFMMIYPIILSIIAPISGYLSDKIGSEILTFLGLIFISLGLFFMSSLNEYSSLLTFTIFVLIMSTGNGLFQSPNNSLIMSSVPKDRLGIAGSINALVRNLGIVTGISLSTTLLYNRMSYKTGYPVDNFIKGREDVFVYGMKYVYITTSIICLSGAALTLWRLLKRKKLKSI
ncbi:multidrug resistance protein Stp [Clostridium homopropionicum DSM 5847]|uniref:Multidrug resistance protein Stp n=1 Tax=Clostridium homopropionicum DSM 5847 TaxID=1121318 RepID=A0A0L6ZCH2_9CLOT|nr:MFS transporter [Clostridium homopropionicum]KOA20679.1 multidrug resistance protein Stp [Clostridium homopropionicum DSM 5847]SFF91664.1 Predicted arabinose efflux permease, MFS family [Clostridium homopropionicum]